MKRTAETARGWKGAAIWSRGFRPFFLLAGVWAVVALALWPALFLGQIEIPTTFSAVDWHVHEMIFGYGSAVVAGFLLTAIPNWTGRLPVTGMPLCLLTSLWAAGRIAVFASAVIGWVPAAIVDVGFLLAFAVVAGREVIAGRNWRNAKTVGIVIMLATANAAFHLEAAMGGGAVTATRAGLAIIVFLILLIGGRVVPSFTHNWLAKRGVSARPVPFGRPDVVVMALSGLALSLWVIAPDQGWTGAGLLVAGATNLWRLYRWRGWSTYSDRLVLVLHVGFLFAALGFLFAGGHAVQPDLVPSAAGVHVWAVGAIGTMTLAMMTRATLGHAGHELAAANATQFIYGAVIAATAIRVTMAFLPAYTVMFMYAAASIWIAAFAVFLIAYGPLLARSVGKAD